MKAERDIAIPPHHQAANLLGGGRWGFGFGKKRQRARRGEREAHNLLWRRRFRLVERVLTGVFLIGAAGFCVAAVRGGMIGDVGRVLAARFNTMSVQAGLTVNEIRVSGQNHVPLADIRAALNVRYGESIFAVDLDQARQRIEKLSWVASASVFRQLPNDLEVEIVERAPFALWQDKDHLWLIDANGMLLTDKNLGDYARLPMVVGDGAGREAASLIALLKRNPALYARVKSAVRVSDRRWDLIMNDGVRVRLPDENEDLAYARLGRIEKDTQVLERNIDVVDLRYPGQLVLQLGHDAAGADLETGGLAKHGVNKGKAASPDMALAVGHRRGGDI